MDREVCKLESLSVVALRNLLGDSVQRAGGNVNVSIIAYLEAPAISLSAVNISSACRDKIDIVRLARLHALLGDRPHALVKIDLLPGRFGQLALAHQREEESASLAADRLLNIRGTTRRGRNHCIQGSYQQQWTQGQRH